ncbi:TonB-dependent receptor [Leptospira weilii serovar Ranarum str. ICFT]|uniref:TonB-dependent receptor n=1 Tax=Leptospira weilii serovar Ranarum str. ICFT TaxID=1218598 RepID=N1WSP3_9LEPT|nr:TonB-dependent receptor [Leptospira weilii]EMY78863.1 TonB-dependent receptor [Leptospira weilii serovar Ranarum str. ICFT]
MNYEFISSRCYRSNKTKFLSSDREILKNKIQNKTFRIFHFVNFRILSHFCKFSVKILFFGILSILYAEESSRFKTAEFNKETSEKNGGIVVQGKKDRRDLEIFKTPSSISRFNEQDILDTGISRTNDIDKQVPNFAIIDSGARNFTYYNIRGMRSTLFSDPSVGIILDGVPLADNVALNTELFALESIEVHRGSQATVFGKNFQGGVIEINTKKPNNMPQGRFTIDFGNYKKKEYSFFYNTPLIKNTLYIGVSGKSTERSGYLKNIRGFHYPNNLVSDIPVEFYKTHPDGRRGKSGRLRFYWTPAENFEIDLQTSAESFDDGSLNIVNYLASKTDRRKSLVKGCAVSPENCEKNFRTYINRTKSVRKVYWDYEGISNTTGNTYSGNISYKLPKAIFKTASSIRKMAIDPLNVDGDFTRSAMSKSEYVEKSITRTHETNIESKNKKDPFQFKIGTLLYHKISDKDFTQEHLTQSYTYNVLKGLNAPARETHHSRIEDKSLSLFTHNSYTFWEKFTLTLGARIETQKIKIGHSRDATGVLFDNPYGDVRILSPHYNRDDSYRYNVSRIIFDYKPIESLMIFTGLSRGYKNAGYSTVVNQASFAAFKPEINDTVEVGIKSKYFKNTLGINITYFYTETSDFHVIRAISIAEAVNLNAEKVTIRGAEMETYVKPWKLLKLGFSAGYTEGIFNKFYDRILNANFDGKRVHFIPQYDVVSYLQYRSALGPFFRWEFQAVGKMFFATDNTIYSSPYTVTNLKIGYEKERLSAYVYCNNLNNEYYFTSYIDGTFQAVPGAPRTYGFIVNYKI